MSVPRAGRGARSILLVVAVAGVLAACGQEPGRIASEPRRPSVPDRVPIVFLPGVGREVARVLRGGGLVPFSALGVRPG
ncbi:MAG: hypothetical protein HYS69_11280 [candidate division NC10 bacterium]|nr:hypothetical protein [candidate division NC10 bacterium]